MGFPWTERAVEQSAHEIRDTWLDAAASAAMSAAEKTRYGAGLLEPDSLLYPDNGNPFAARIVNRAYLAGRLEVGWQTYHLPERINWAQAKGAKRSKRGAWYMAIPFAHAPASMPRTVARAVQHLRPGQRLTSNPRAWGRRALYVRGMTPYVPRFARNVRPGYQHAARQEGLRLTSPRGGARTYGTFRTMASDSPGWWIPGRQGLQLAPQVVRTALPRVVQVLEAGARRDVEAMFSGWGGTP